MPKDPDQLMLRISPDVIARLDRLASALSETSEVRALGPRRGSTRSYAARLCLLSGLEEAEREHGLVPKARKR